MATVTASPKHTLLLLAGSLLNLPQDSAVVGSVQGKFQKLFDKLAKVQQKNSFDFAIVVGDLFATTVKIGSSEQDELVSLLNGDLAVPLPTYFSVGEHSLPEAITKLAETSNGEICPNLYFLGHKNVTNTSEGLRIVTLGGRLCPDVSEGGSMLEHAPYYSENDALALKGANSADIIVTADWPFGISHGSETMAEKSNSDSSPQCIAELCAALKPRYHFAASKEKFYEREPFVHHTADTTTTGHLVTRFISLAPFENVAKHKWIYAFSLEPKVKEVYDLPSGCTSSPFEDKKKDSNQKQKAAGFWGGETSQHKSRKRRRNSPKTARPCFFCLSNPDTATHLITSIGNDSYLTIAKGPLITNETFGEPTISAHILIIPMAHIPKLSLIPDPDLRQNSIREMSRYRKALETMIGRLCGSRLGSITWEIGRRAGVHDHWQFLPIPVDLIDRGLLDAAFMVEAENEKYPILRREEIVDYKNDGVSDFFRAIIWRPTNTSNTTANVQNQPSSDISSQEYALILPLDDDTKFDVQFGRKVLAKLLNLETRVRWQDCVESVDKESSDAESFKKVFEQFDFTLES